MADTFTTRIHEGAQGALPDLAEAWRACLAACPPEQHLFNFNWFDSWSRTYGACPPWSGRSCVVVAHDSAGSPCAILPLVFRRAQGLTYLSHAGFYQPVRSFPCVPQAAVGACNAIARALVDEVKGWDALRLGPLDAATPERAALLQALAAILRHRVAIPRGRTIVNRLHPAYEDYATSKTGKKFEGYARRFAREPGAAIRHFGNPTGADAAVMYRDLQTVEKHSWLAGAGGDLRFGSDTDQAFWRRVTENCLSPGHHLNVWIAYAGEKPVAFRFVLSSGTADYLIANQYDEEFGKFDLGWILYLDHLRLAIPRGTRTIDLAPGDLHYKGRLGGEETDPRQDLIYFRNSLKGQALSRALRGLQASKTWLGARTGLARKLADRLPRI